MTENAVHFARKSIDAKSVDKLFPTAISYSELRLGSGVMGNMISVRAIAFQQGGEKGPWLAQGLEYDIVVHAERLEAIPNAFMRAVLENIIITEHLGREPLEGIKAAPAHFHAMFESADMEMKSLKRFSASFQEQTVLPDISVRVASQFLAT